MDIIAAIRARETQIAELKREVAALYRALALLTGDKNKPVRSAASYRSDGMVARALTILAEEGGPLHVDRILERMAAAGSPAQKNSLVPSLFRLSRSGRLVRRVAPNTFARIHDEERAAEPDDCPRDGEAESALASVYGPND